jgi:hypothetical protein
VDNFSNPLPLFVGSTFVSSSLVGYEGRTISLGTGLRFDTFEDFQWEADPIKKIICQKQPKTPKLIEDTNLVELSCYPY